MIKLNMNSDIVKVKDVIYKGYSIPIYRKPDSTLHQSNSFSLGGVSNDKVPSNNK